MCRGIEESTHRSIPQIPFLMMLTAVHAPSGCGVAKRIEVMPVAGRTEMRAQ